MTTAQLLPMNQALLSNHAPSRSRMVGRIMDSTSKSTSTCSGEPTNQSYENKDRLLVQPIPGTYQQLFQALLVTDFNLGTPAQSPFSRVASSPRTLPPELCDRVLSFLTVHRVQQDKVRATNCSSHDGIHSLRHTLRDNETTWWLSKTGSMPNGRGKQWVQYLLDESSNLVRVSSVSIKIPPMPQGPLSVREFCLQTFSIERGWHAVTPTFQVGNQTGWQKFDFDAVDVEEIRLVCLSNQMSKYFSNGKGQNFADQELMDQLSRFESVGFFAVKFG